jgi:hypothetical protein
MRGGLKCGADKNNYRPEDNRVATANAVRQIWREWESSDASDILHIAEHSSSKKKKKEG